MIANLLLKLLKLKRNQRKLHIIFSNPVFISFCDVHVIFT